MARFVAFGFLLLSWIPSPLLAQGNLLRNGSFQDDWITHVPENKNHHWCYSSEFYHRRDFNPDGWICKGKWQWQNADAPYGQRRLVVHGPAEITQRVNWVLVHDSENLGNMADAGRFPQIQLQRSRFPERVVRDLTLRMQLSGKEVPAKAGVLELGLCPPGGLTLADPLGSATPPTTVASVPIPEGTYTGKWVEVKLPAMQWLQAVKNDAAKNPKEAAELAKNGPVLPGTVRVVLRYQADKGSLEVDRAELSEPGPASPNLLPHGDFGGAKAQPGELIAGWSGPSKYRYFPGRLYYLFNTWHNSASDNRGKVQVDDLVGARTLQMLVPAGDEVAVSSRPIALNQKEPRLLEVRAWVRTDRLAMLHLDAVDDKGQRLDGFPFIHMAPHSIGTDGWRQIRQIFRPRRPLQSVRLMLCARGVNGFTLDDTGPQPQNNVAGTIWWDAVTLYEPESTAAELNSRGAKAISHRPLPRLPVIADFDLGERLLGENVLTATLHGVAEGPFAVQWEFVSPTGKKSQYKSALQKLVDDRGVFTRGVFKIPYQIQELCPPYTEYRGTVSLLNEKNQPVASSELWFATWTVPIDVDLGALYLRPGQKQFVRLNLGLSHATLKKLAGIRLEVVRRGTGQVVKSQDLPASLALIEAQRGKIPIELRDDFTNLLLADLDVSFLPVQPFHDPQRNWFVRASARDAAGKILAAADSSPFCRQNHQPDQPAVKTVTIKNQMVFVNGQPWMPWGVVYGHVPVYAGPADPGPGKYLDLVNLQAWGMYDRFSAAAYSRKQANDISCIRYVAGSVTDPKLLDKLWTKDNLYASSAFVVPNPVNSVQELVKQAGGPDKLQSYLTFCKTAPMVVSVAPGIEEAFGLFHTLTPQQLKGLAEVAAYLRKATGKPVMVGHGGYWNRLEFEKVPFFDIFDPETEPLYPANLHTDLKPLLKNSAKVIWLRPQMYEDVPYERWRFHVFVELMRGCRGWQIAHGPGDPSLFRGLHGELDFFKPIVAAGEPGPKIDIQPGIEHWSRRYKGKTYVIAATTRGLTLGRWRWHDEPEGGPVARSRGTTDPHLYLAETNSYGADQKVDQGPTIHGIQYLPDARSWPAGSKLIQWVRLDAKARPDNLVVLAKREGRWLHAASWGKFDPAAWTKDPDRALWFLRSFYRHAYGFLGWGTDLVEKAKMYIPSKTVAMGDLPAAGEWLRLEVPLAKIGATDGLLDGVAFAHDGGRAFWGPTTLVDPQGKEATVWGNTLEHPPGVLAKTRIAVPGLKAGRKIRVLFEDRELTAGDGFFVDDFRGQDLYQRFGGGYGVGYGNGPVALHLYELNGP